MSVHSAAGVTFEVEVPVAIVGAGACGLIAGLAAADAGVPAVIFERDALPSGSTALSSGLIPAAGTRFQRALGIDDTPALFAKDLTTKAHGEADPAIVARVATGCGPTVEWLADRYGIPFVVLTGFLYPGHSRERMHAHPDKTGRALIDALRTAAERAEIEIVTDAQVVDLYADADGRVRGLATKRPDGHVETIGCEALVLACNGFGGNPSLVREHIPEMASAIYFGHTGNRGEAIEWGTALGAATRHLTAYQGHGSVAHPHGILITWALMSEGGFQVNARGQRFSNEHLGYSEQSVPVLAQPDGLAWDIYDERRHKLGLEFPDYRDAVAAGAIMQAESIDALAKLAGLPANALAETFAAAARMQRGEARDPYGRDFTSKPPLAPPYCAIKVTGALFHTQGGLVIDRDARVLRADGTALPNLFAGGGAACGVSGSFAAGYLSGNGLLTAVTLGRLAGEGAAKLIRVPA